MSELLDVIGRALHGLLDCGVFFEALGLKFLAQHIDGLAQVANLHLRLVALFVFIESFGMVVAHRCRFYSGNLSLSHNFLSWMSINRVCYR